MSFRERTAWITLITIVVFMGGFFTVTLTGIVPSKSMGAFHLGLQSIIGLVLFQIVLNVLASLLNPKDARTPRDEREQAIHARSHVLGYYVLMIGMAVTLVSTHLPFEDDDFVDVLVRTIQIGMGAMVIAALSVAIAQIIMYRRGY